MKLWATLLCGASVWLMQPQSPAFQSADVRDWLAGRVGLPFETLNGPSSTDVNPALEARSRTVALEPG